MSRNVMSLEWWRGVFRNALASRSELDLRRDTYHVSFDRRSADDKWTQWQLDATQIQRLLTHTFNRRYAFREIRRMFRLNTNLHINDARYVAELIFEFYGHFISMAVRREVDKSFDVLSFGRLLDEIRRAPEAFTKAKYFAHFTPTSKIAEIDDFHLKGRGKWWKDMAGDGDFIDPTVIKRDIRRIGRRAKQVMLYADKVVAHRALKEATDIGSQPPSEAELAEIELTISHVDAALDNIEEIFKKYYVMLTASSLMGLEPTMQFHWMRAFEVPWADKPFYQAAREEKDKEELPKKQAVAKGVMDKMTGRKP